MMKNEKLNFVIASDVNYFRHYAALFASIFHYSPNIVVRIYVVGDCECIQFVKFSNWIIKRCSENEVAPLKIPESAFDGIHVGDYHLSVVTYFRLLAAKALQNTVSRFLYLDGDMIVQDDLRKIYNLDLGNSILAAAPEPIFYNESSLSLVFGKDETFNAGLLLVDVDQFSNQCVGEEAIRIALSRKLRYHDQDALNETLVGKWLRLDPRWNLQLFSESIDSKYGQYSAQESIHAFNSPGVIHFVGPRKPWMPFSNHPYRAEYWKFNAQTPWANERHEWKRFFIWAKGKIKRTLFRESYGHPKV